MYLLEVQMFKLHIPKMQLGYWRVQVKIVDIVQNGVLGLNKHKI
jgi:hypothetical protein